MKIMCEYYTTLHKGPEHGGFGIHWGPGLSPPWLPRNDDSIEVMVVVVTLFHFLKPVLGYFGLRHF